MTFGAHVHTGPCIAGEPAAAGPHFNITAVGGNPPTTISPATEVWLDFTIRANGTAHSNTKVPFTIPAGGAGAVVVHALPTDPATGAAGARLACLPAAF
jgi:Cu/Zn superoxide dismutase